MQFGLVFLLVFVPLPSYYIDFQSNLHGRFHFYHDKVMLAMGAIIHLPSSIVDNPEITSNSESNQRLLQLVSIKDDLTCPNIPATIDGKDDGDIPFPMW